MDQKQAGGGTLLDSGSHLLDLARWAMDDFVEVVGFIATNGLQRRPGSRTCEGTGHLLEDNAGGIFKTADGRLAVLHTSWTQWHRSMVMEIGGTEGTLMLDNDARMTILSTRHDCQERFDFSHIASDPSHKRELEEFLTAIHEDRQPLGNGHDGLQVVRLAFALYEASLTGEVVRL